ncbi:MAG: winged helix DNA-binding domain-containing protein [Gaiella sp.]|nr:winged helix DNA-binding domain-containing protein [Gaiella sp.]
MPESASLRRPGTGRAVVPVGADEARRIAVRSQLLDGSASDVRDTVRRLGFLQLDPIAVVAPAQHLVLWSRLGGYDVRELDRLLWDERVLFEWDAFVWPIEELPLVRGLMRRWRTSTHYKAERWVREFVSDNRAFRSYVLRELERRGPLLSRELDDRSRGEKEERRWYGSRNVGLMLTSLHLRGEVAIAGRAGGQRLWDLAERVLPAGEALSLRDAEQRLAEKRFRALGVRAAAGGFEAHPDARDGDVPDRVTFLSPFDRLVHDRDRAEALFGFHYRLEMFVPEPKRRFGYYVLPILRRDHLVGRIEPVFDRRAGTLAVRGVWAEPGAPPDAGAVIRSTLEELAAWLGAPEVVVRGPLPRIWARALRA